MFKMKAKLKEGSSPVGLGMMFRKRNESIIRTLIIFEEDKGKIIFTDDHECRWTTNYLNSKFQMPKDDKSGFEFLGFKQKDND